MGNTTNNPISNNYFKFTVTPRIRHETRFLCG